MAVELTGLIVPRVIVGKAFTVPLAATVWVVAPVLAQVTLPLGVPVAVEAMRTKIVVISTIPPLCVSVTDGPKSPPSVLTSKSVGAVTVISAVRLLPLTLKY